MPTQRISLKGLMNQRNNIGKLRYRISVNNGIIVLDFTGA